MKITMRILSAFLLLVASVAIMAQGGKQKSIFWGYSGSDILGGYGPNNGTAVSAAIYVPAEVATYYKGKNISAVKIGLNADVTEATVFVAKDLNGSYQSSANKSDVKKGWTTIDLTTSYEIDGTPFYIGYTCTGYLPIGYTAAYDENACWMSVSGKWQDYAKSEEKRQALAIRAKMNGDDFPLDLSILSLDGAYAPVGKAFKVTGTVESLGSKNVKNYELSYSINGDEGTPTTFKTFLMTNTVEDFEIELPGCDEPGTHELRVWISSVNGSADNFEGNNSKEVALQISEHNFVQRMVVEEGTGTWCGYCPRGIVALAELTERFPDQFIGIAVHSGDEMYTNSYAPILNYWSGFPNSMINRDVNRIMDPNTNALLAQFNELTSKPAIVDVAVSSAYTDASKSTLKATAKMAFATDNNNANYRVAFVIVENSINALQANNYAGSTVPVGGFEKLSSWANIYLDHVARDIYEYNGYANSVPTKVSVGQTYEFSQEIKLPSNIDRKHRCEIIALLFDGVSGTIANAAKAHFPDYIEEYMVQFDKKGRGTVSVKNMANGSDVLSGKLVEDGGEIEVSMTPVAKYVLDSLWMNGVNVTNQVVDNKFRCKVTEDLEFYASFVPATGLETGNLARRISVYPNPFIDFIHIKGLEGETCVRVFDVAGVCVAERHVASPEASVDMSNMAKGTYVVRVSDKDGVVLHKLLKR